MSKCNWGEYCTKRTFCVGSLHVRYMRSVLPVPAVMPLPLIEYKDRSPRCPTICRVGAQINQSQSQHWLVIVVIKSPSTSSTSSSLLFFDILINTLGHSRYIISNLSVHSCRRIHVEGSRLENSGTLTIFEQNWLKFWIIGGKLISILQTFTELKGLDSAWKNSAKCTDFNFSVKNWPSPGFPYRVGLRRAFSNTNLQSEPKLCTLCVCMCVRQSY